MSVDIRKIAVSFRIPSVSIMYIESGVSKYRRFPVAFSYFTAPAAIKDVLYDEYPFYFNPGTISEDKLLNFLSQALLRAPHIDLSTATPEVIAQFKETMNKEFEMNAIKPGDPDFQYDVREDFGSDSDKESCGWD